MPKIVDHNERRREIADAMWRVLHSGGIESVTIRAVAAEAGLSKATLAHYFDGQYGLLLFAMNTSIEDATNELRLELGDSRKLADFASAVCEVVPTTSKRRRQSEIWLALVARAQSDAKLRADLNEVNAGVAAGLRELLELMRERGLLDGHRDLDVECARLHGLIDGLSLHTLTSPKAMSGSFIKKIVATHLADLATQ